MERLGLSCGDGPDMVTEQDFSRKLNVSLRARVTLIVVVTPEEERVITQIRNVCDSWEPSRQCLVWDSVDGFSVITGNKNFLTQSRDPLLALDDIGKSDENAVIILKDFHEYWNNPQVKRKIRNCSQKFRYNRRSMVIITPVPRVPDEIRDDAVVIHFPPPDTERAAPPISIHFWQQPASRLHDKTGEGEDYPGGAGYDT